MEIYKTYEAYIKHMLHHTFYLICYPFGITVLCGHHHYAFLELFRLSSQKFGSHETITPHSSLSSAPGNHYPTLCFCKIAYFKIPKIL